MPRAGAVKINSGRGSVGDVQSSMMTEAQFQALNGVDWVLSDGRNVAGSKYATIKGVTTVPDLRGVTLRGKNNGRVDGGQNPDGDLALGTFQSHQNADHGHAFSQGMQNASSGVPGNVLIGGGVGQNVIAAFSSLGNSGGNETRMKNVTVNHFVKIN